MKKTIKHAIAIALIVGFAVLALGSMESTPSSGGSYSGGGSSSSSCSRNFTCYKEGGIAGAYLVCGNSNCNVVAVLGKEYWAECNCRK